MRKRPHIHFLSFRCRLSLCCISFALHSSRRLWFGDLPQTDELVELASRYEAGLVPYEFHLENRPEGWTASLCLGQRNSLPCLVVAVVVVLFLTHSQVQWATTSSLSDRSCPGSSLVDRKTIPSFSQQWQSPLEIETTKKNRKCIGRSIILFSKLMLLFACTIPLPFPPCM